MRLSHAATIRSGHARRSGRASAAHRGISTCCADGAASHEERVRYPMAYLILAGEVMLDATRVGASRGRSPVMACFFPPRLPRIVHYLLACFLLFGVALPCQAAPVTIDLTLSGRHVQADVYRPEGTPRGAVILAHGFLRDRATMAEHAAALAGQGVVALVPDLPYITDSRENGAALVELIARIRAGILGQPIDRIVLVGFSAGGLSTLLAAASPGVVGYVGLDAFDRPGGVGLAAAKNLRTPAILLRGPPSFCNAFGIATPWALVLPNLIDERVIDGTSHCDFESPTDAWCTLVCGATDAARQRAIRDALLTAVERLLPRDRQ